MNKILLLLALLLAVTSAFDTTTRVRGRRIRKMVAKGHKVHGKKQTTPSTKYPAKKGKSSKSSKAPTVEAASGAAVDVSEREVRRDTSLPFLYKHAESLEDLEMLRKDSESPSPTPTVFFPEKSSASEASSPSPTVIKNASTKAPTVTSKHPSLLNDGDEDCSPVSYTQPDEREYVCANDESYESPFNGSCGCELFEGTDCNAWIALLNETQVAEIWTRCPESCGACSTEKGLLCSDDPTYRNPMNENIGCGLFDNNCDGEPWIWSFTESQIAEAITRCPISCGVPCPKASSSTPSSVPTERDSSRPTNEASDFPSLVPSSPPSVVDTSPPSQQHSLSPSNLLSSIPSSAHSNMPSSSSSLKPSFTPTGTPSFFPTKAPSFKPSNTYTDRPSNSPSSAPTVSASDVPSASPSLHLSERPSEVHSSRPTSMDSSAPTIEISTIPTEMHTNSPSESPSVKDSEAPSLGPSISSSSSPSTVASNKPSMTHSNVPSISSSPTQCLDDPTYRSPINTNFNCDIYCGTDCFSWAPLFNYNNTQLKEIFVRCPDACNVPCDFDFDDAYSSPPSSLPTSFRSGSPTDAKSSHPSLKASNTPTTAPTLASSQKPSKTSSSSPTIDSTLVPSTPPTNTFSSLPTVYASQMPTVSASQMPSLSASFSPSSRPSGSPSVFPSETLSNQPSASPSQEPSEEPSMSRPCNLSDQDRTKDMMKILEAHVSDSLSLLDLNTPQGKAFDWLVNDDKAQLCPNENYLCPDRLTQRFALAVIYFSTGGEQWNSCFRSDIACGIGGEGTPFNGDYSFLNEVHECQWAGIGCNSQQCVTVINWENNNVVGQIPSEIGLLKHLRYWAMEQGELSSTIPSSVSNLEKLLLLDLDFNMLTGTLPSEIFSLTNLLELDLNNNTLSGSIDGIQNLSELTFLQLHSNSFTGEIPSSFGNLKRLERMTSYDTFLVGGVPPEICWNKVGNETSGGALARLHANCPCSCCENTCP